MSTLYDVDMHYVYVLLNLKTHKPYIGQTKSLRQRFSAHQGHGSFNLVYYEAYRDPHAAYKREKLLKNYGTTWTRLKQRLDTSFKMAG